MKYPALIITLLFIINAPLTAAPKLAGGIKIGEVTSDSAIIWTRLTATDHADFQKLPIFTQGLRRQQKDNSIPRMPTDVLPGITGEVKVTYSLQGSTTKKDTGWNAVDPEKDFTKQLLLKGLQAGEKYHITVEARPASSSTADSHKVTAKTTGSFHTAPTPTASKTVRFIVTTCQAVRSIDSGANGHIAYQTMLAFEPHFFAHTGDILYYDKAPFAKTIPEARAKWNLMFAYQHNQNFHRQVSSYFMKDDHDTLVNDCWPGQTYGDLTFSQGLEIFREQVPMGQKTYRTIRWGKDVQIWLTENRDFRSPNNIPDSPDKTILGATQKAWLKRTILASTATHKFIVSPGPINDQHMFGGNPGYKPKFHRYFSGKGGFLGITVKDGKAKAQWFAAQLHPKTKKLQTQHTEHLPVPTQNR